MIKTTLLSQSTQPIIDGKAMAVQRLSNLKGKVTQLKITPKLAIVMKAGNPAMPAGRQASEIYVRQKVKAAQLVGITVEIVESIEMVPLDANGVIVQLPYPNADAVIAKIPLEKDVDNLTGKSKFLGATVAAVLLVAGDLTGKSVVVVGQGILVGRPLSDYLEKQKIAVIRCDEFTKNLAEKTKQADVLVVATGVPNLIKVDMVKPGAVVIDCGSPKAEVDFDSVSRVALAITPVPGGIGPLTVVSLLENVVEAAL